MNFFVGIVPPGEISKAIHVIQTQFGDNRLEPHITVRPPIALKDEARWTEAIEQVANSFGPFNVELTNTGYFGKGVLYMEAVSSQLTLLHNQLVKSIEPFEGKKPKEFKEKDFHPHLTLGRLWCGFTKEGFIEMEQLAKDFLSKQISFTVDFVRVYYKPNNNEGYKILNDIPLKKSV